MSLHSNPFNGVFNGPMRMRASTSGRLRAARYSGASMVIDTPNVLGIAMTLSPTYQVTYRSGGRTGQGSPRVGAITIATHDPPVRATVAGQCNVLQVSLPWSDMTRWLAEDHGLDARRVTIRPTFQVEDPRLARLLYQAAADESGEEAFLRAAAAHLLACHATVPQHRAAARTAVKGGLAPQRLRRVLDLVEAHPGPTLSLTRLAAEAELSPFHFAREFARAMGETPHAFVLRRSVERAIAFMGDPDMPLADVAQKAGFAHSSHLARQMRRVTGLSPIAVRSLLLL